MNGTEDLNFTVLVTAVANVIAEQLSDEELDLLSAVLVLAGDVLATVSARRNSRKGISGPDESP